MAFNIAAIGLIMVVLGLFACIVIINIVAFSVNTLLGILFVSGEIFILGWIAIAVAAGLEQSRR